MGVDLLVQPAGTVYCVSSMKKLSSVLVTMGEIPKHEPSVGMLATVIGVGFWLQPGPWKMVMGTEVARGARLGAALMPTAATRRAIMDLVCILTVGLEEAGSLRVDLLVFEVEVDGVLSWLKLEGGT
jgi:hypothetical protein